MKTENDYQLELFSSSKHYSTKKSPSRPFFTYVRGYEKVVLIITVVFVTSVVSFSVGVERGKRIALSKSDIPFTEKTVQIEYKVIPQGAPALQAPKPQSDSVVAAAQLPRVLPAPQQVAGGSYTVQLASYKKKVDAQKEAQKLKKKGLSPVILPKGSYMILCVGSFSSKAPAKQLVLELQKHYRDCYVRRL